MPLEIERKYLLKTDRWRALVEKSTPMRHGYLSAEGGKASVRVRIQGDVGMLNVKAATVGVARAEFEYEIPIAHAAQMLETLCNQLILKTRHYLHHGGLLWEIDAFEGENAGLVVAEVELEQEDQAIDFPDWLGEEVTHLHRYYNTRLAVHPFQGWTALERDER
jgi:adenylate cyclase